MAEKWQLWYKAGGDWNYNRDIAMAGFIANDGEYHVNAYTFGPSTVVLEAGTPIWATFSPDRSDGAPGYDIWYVDSYDNAAWLDGLDGGDIMYLVREGVFQLEEEIFSEIEERYARGEF